MSSLLCLRARSSLLRLTPLWLLACLPSLGCGESPPDGTPPPQGKAYQYPLDDVLRLQHVQVRGTHNSYHVDSYGGRFAPWAYTHRPIYEQLDRLGIRQLELDVNYDLDSGLEVFHVAGVDEGTRCRRFADCLAEVRRFSDAYPGHLPIYIQIEPKADPPADQIEPFFAQLESAIRAAFPAARIITPDEVRGDFPTLRDALGARGWPTLGALRGRVLLALDTSGSLRTAYTHGGKDLIGRLLFVDSAPSDPFAAVAVLNSPPPSGAMDAFARALSANLLIRTRADSDTDEAQANDRRRGQQALDSGAHFISTDFPEPAPPLTYSFEVPLGTPARCNPITAPMRCTAQAIEDPAFVGSAPAR
jgi:hypothetical protein